MTYNRYATDDNGNVVTSNYNSDGEWIGEGPDPRTMRHFLSNMSPSPVLEELITLANKHTGFKVIYRLGGQTYAEMDWMDRAEAYESGYVEDPTVYALFYEGPTPNLSAFWEELNRLQTLIKEPLNERELADDYLTYGGYLYVVDGKVTESDLFGSVDGGGITVAEYKRRTGAKEVFSCDIEGRHLRNEATKEYTRNHYGIGSRSTVLSPSPNDWKTSHTHKRRRPRNSNKIKKIR